MTAKPFIYVFNVDDNELANKELQAKLAASVAPAPAVFLNAQFESDLTDLDEADAREMLEDAGLSESGLDQLARVGFDILGLQTFLTAGVKEVRAWQIHKGWTAPQAAGVIHTDFERGFIKPTSSPTTLRGRRRLHGQDQGGRQAPSGGTRLRHAGRRHRRVQVQRLQRQVADRRKRWKMAVFRRIQGVSGMERPFFASLEYGRFCHVFGRL